MRRYSSRQWREFGLPANLLVIRSLREIRTQRLAIVLKMSLMVASRLKPFGGEILRKLALIAILASLAALGFGQRTPIALTGYNFDGIADGASATSSTTGTLDSIYD